MVAEAVAAALVAVRGVAIAERLVGRRGGVATTAAVPLPEINRRKLFAFGASI